MVRHRVKLCDRCNQSAPILYRVRWNQLEQWQFVCNGCHLDVSHDHPDYAYGGTWKAKKR